MRWGGGVVSWRPVLHHFQCEVAPPTSHPCRIALSVCDVAAAAACLSERAYLRALQGGCQVPIGVHGVWEAAIGGSGRLRGAAGSGASASSGPAVRTLRLEGTILSLDGGQRVTAAVAAAVDCSPHRAATPVAWRALVDECGGVGGDLAARSLAVGGAEILGPITGVARPITYGRA
jgi:hypothetical protein